jgi:hypothetical protein
VVWVWTPTPDEQLESELQAALARPGALHVRPPRPVALTTEERVTGWLWGQKRTDDGVWLGLATLYRGHFFDPPELGWHPAGELRTLD